MMRRLRLSSYLLINPNYGFIKLLSTYFLIIIIILTQISFILSEEILQNKKNNTIENNGKNNETLSEDFLKEEDFLAALKPLEDDPDVTFLTNDDFNNAKNINTNKDKKNHILGKQKFFHGDIRGKAAWTNSQKDGIRRNGVISIIKKWPNGRIPYIISSQYTVAERAVLAKAIQEYHTRTCIRFVPKTSSDSDYLYIGKIDGCFSDVGRAGGRQELSLDNGCLQYDTAIHELMHSVGFYHEHERWDRDNYISILWNNIDREAYDQFGKVDLTESSYYGQPYDYRSILHYDSMAFSKNGFETLVAKTSGMTPIMGSALDFSSRDLYKINKMYKCNEFFKETDKTNILNKEQFNRFGIYNNINGPMTFPPIPIQPIGTTKVPFSTINTISPYTPLVTLRPIDGLSIYNNNGDEKCVDKTNLCWRWIDRCTSFFFKKVMEEFCPASCGFCTPKKNKIRKAKKLTKHGSLISDFYLNDQENKINKKEEENLLQNIGKPFYQRFG
ncbi:Astacin-like metalloendopeptidase [Strongyloides ratti]|uniref:Metalloendopeptidase n=1 Tax=Strongyloides ratti TaxID=34506 RepID=A0A090LTZ8_STRRB|nr:Astacin-like metalloendopeptidase [Strongyloides ratti]CEF71114.1 Astacin-like metalloendopeptidase [Strongyloides ratti]